MAERYYTDKGFISKGASLNILDDTDSKFHLLIPVSDTYIFIFILLEIFISIVNLYAYQKEFNPESNKFGKIKTVLQMIAIPMLLLNDWPFHYFDHDWPEFLQVSNLFFYAATIMSLVSGVIYVYQNRSVIKGKK